MILAEPPTAAALPLNTIERARRIAAPLAAALLTACSPQSDQPPPCPARLVESSYRHGDSARLTWTPAYENVDGSPAGVPIGYRILYGATPDDLACSLSVRDASAKSAVLAGLPPGEWHFAVVQVASESVESVPSNAVSKRIE